MAEEVIKVIVTQGILGVIAALFIGLYLAEKSAHNKTKEAHVAIVKTMTDAAAAAAKEYAQAQQALLMQINDLREAHAIRERACLQTVEDFSAALVRGVEELGRIAATIRKIHDRRPQQR